MRWSTGLSFTLSGALVGGLWGCYVGSGTLGSVCSSDAQCGVDQRCRHSLCGQCNDAAIQPGELCYGNSSEEYIFGQVSYLAAYRAGPDFFPIPLAVMNHNCEFPPDREPPDEDGFKCWDLIALFLDGDGDFEPRIPAGQEAKDGIVTHIGVGNFDNSQSTDIAMAVQPSDMLTEPAIAVLFDLFEVLARLDAGEVVVPDSVPVSYTPQTVHAADMDGDGLDDLLASARDEDLLMLLRADPSSPTGFAPEQYNVVGPNPRPAPPVDMDGDGDLDVVLFTQMERELIVALNDGNGGLLPSPGVDFSDTPGIGPVDLEVADIDQDGKLDVVMAFAAPFDDPSISSSLQIYRGTGGGQLEFEQSLAGGEFPAALLAEDINFDGWPDIVIADVREDKLPMYINREGSFPDIVTVDVAAAPIELLYTDANRDDVPDIVVAHANGVVAVVPAEN